MVPLCSRSSGSVGVRPAAMSATGSSSDRSGSSDGQWRTFASNRPQRDGSPRQPYPTRRSARCPLGSPGRVYVAELGYRAGMWPGTVPPHPGATGGRVSIFDSSGKLISRFCGGANPSEPGDFFAPHDIWLES